MRKKHHVAKYRKWTRYLITNTETTGYRSRKISNAQNNANAKYRIAQYKMAKYRLHIISTGRISNSQYRMVKYLTKNMEMKKYRTQTIEGTKYQGGIISNEKISNRYRIECKRLMWQNIKRKLLRWQNIQESCRTCKRLVYVGLGYVRLD